MQSRSPAPELMQAVKTMASHSQSELENEFPPLQVGH